MSTTDTRAAFEIQAAKDGYRIEVGPNGKDYLSGHTQVAWEWWQAATEAAKATGTAGELPSMPEPFGVIGEYADEERDVWDYEQMRTYGQACAEAARQPASASGMLKVVRGEICYKSEADDQSYGMWCPVTPDHSPAYPDGTEFRAALAATAAPVLVTESKVDDHAWQRACKEIIDRCVAPDMYSAARAMLDAATNAAIQAQKDGHG